MVETTVHREEASTGMLKSKIAKVTVAGGIALSTLGIGAGVANADPVAPQPAPTQTQQNPNHDKQNPSNQQPAGHGFWLFGLWIPLP
ncbi:hypothetical protein [Nocardia seriolae]|uniref:hypothetical protein n=1 Tax=Nocardia seriolae TaxID=37332 RepID=UPI0035204F36